MPGLKRFHRPTLAAVLALACAGLGLAACTEQGARPGSRSGEPLPTIDGQVRFNDHRGGRNALRVELTGIEALIHSSRAELVVTARRFAITFAGWLYGKRRQVEVTPIASELREDLANTPPYVPPQQLGSGDGRAVLVRGFLQTMRSALLVVWIRDSRTSYPVAAQLERRSGRWQVVHLNTH